MDFEWSKSALAATYRGYFWGYSPLFNSQAIGKQWFID